MKYLFIAVIIASLLSAVMYATKSFDLSVVSTVVDQIVIAGFAYALYLEYKDK